MFPLERLMFEFTEVERLDATHLLNSLRTYRSPGFKTAIDDFGVGNAGLELLSKFQPDIVKLNMALVRDIDQSPVQRAMVRHRVNMLQDLGILPLCEGVETPAEFDVLCDLGVNLMQGYLLARPAVRTLPMPVWPNQSPSRAASV